MLYIYIYIYNILCNACSALKRRGHYKGKDQQFHSFFPLDIYENTF